VFELDGVVGLLFLGLWLYCIYDVITTDEVLVRNLPKPVWIMLTIFLFEIGAVLWLVAGRPHNKAYRPATTDYRSQSRRSVAPEDRPGFGSDDAPGVSDFVREREEQARLRVWEAQLKRREEELRQREQGLGDTPPE
jgi:hypothetical protein